MKLLGISGTIIGTKTEVVVSAILREIAEKYSEIDVKLMNLKDYDLDFCDGRDPSLYSGDTKKLIAEIEDADFFIIGTPIFQGSITGALKNVIDLVPTSAFKHKVMGFVATGGTFQHYLVVENQLKPIASYFRAFVAPGYVYAHDSHFDSKKNIIDEDVNARIKRLADEVVFMQKQLKSGKTADLKHKKEINNV
ncbi:NADPH-dependent FMN reductase [Shouchella rhizosphaerae]|uniref:NADPH-dependent FMN reductase n=1 Tax=Shouchella rhizosphaerae TaxID=866786 RepID=UPI003F8069AE